MPLHCLLIEDLHYKYSQDFFIKIANFFQFSKKIINFQAPNCSKTANIVKIESPIQQLLFSKIYAVYYLFRMPIYPLFHTTCLLIFEIFTPSKTIQFYSYNWYSIVNSNLTYIALTHPWCPSNLRASSNLWTKSKSAHRLAL